MDPKLNYQETHPNYCYIEVLPYKNGTLNLIEPNLSHADESLSWTTDNSIIQYMGAPFEHPSKEKEMERIKEILCNTDEYNWMIELNGKIIGNVSINNIQENTTKFNSKAGNYTILIGDKNYWGKGIAYHVGQAVLDWAFSKGNFDVISARAINENIASLAMLKKLGFIYLDNTPFEGQINGKNTEWQNFMITKQNFLNSKTK